MFILRLFHNESILCFIIREIRTMYELSIESHGTENGRDFFYRGTGQYSSHDWVPLEEIGHPPSMQAILCGTDCG